MSVVNVSGSCQDLTTPDMLPEGLETKRITHIVVRPSTHDQVLQCLTIHS